MPVRVAVLASGGGSNLQALIGRFNDADESVARIELVVASRAGIGALDHAARAGIPAAVLAAPQQGAHADAAELFGLFEQHGIGLVVLAGYLRLVPAEVVREYAGRIINIHPSLLPAFGGPGMYGLRVHRAVIAAGVRVTGATVHLVDEQYDTGAILAQWPVPVLDGDTPESLAGRVVAVEHQLLPSVVARLSGEDGGAAPLAAPASFGLASTAAPDPAEVAALIRLRGSRDARPAPASGAPS